MIVGITGTNSAGKGNLVRALTERGFKHYSVRRFLEEKGAKNRPQLARLANRLRKKHGPSYIVETLYKRARRAKKDAVIESIRNPGEVAALRNLGEFYLIAVNAPVKKRFIRAKKRGSATDDVSFEEFKEQEEQEMRSDDPTKQNISFCMSNADYLFWADYVNAEEARKNFMFGKEAFLNLFPKGKRRPPSFNELYMRKAFEASDRSKCIRRHVGAVISRGEITISDGYNGPVRNAPHCTDVGCKREQLGVPSGQRQEICRGAHAEQNGIINAGRNNTNVIGATIHSTTYPCSFCARAIVNSGIEKVIYVGDYADDISGEILEEGGVEIAPYHGVAPKSYSKFWS